MSAYRSLAADDPRIREHLLAMTPEDRRSRFHGLTSDTRIEQYCAEMTRREAHLVGCFEGERLVGLIEIVITGEGPDHRGDVGMSVAADRRDRGVGRTLVQHALDYAANRNLRLVFGFLPDNIRIPRIVHDLGGRVNQLTAQAEIAPPRATPFTLCLAAIDDLGLFAADMMGFWRKALLAPLDLSRSPEPREAA
jgi:GNAT superfamily N-acetyltransferase